MLLPLPHCSALFLSLVSLFLHGSPLSPFTSIFPGIICSLPHSPLEYLGSIFFPFLSAHIPSYWVQNKTRVHISSRGVQVPHRSHGVSGGGEWNDLKVNREGCRIGRAAPVFTDKRGRLFILSSLAKARLKAGSMIQGQEWLLTSL